MIVQKIQFIGRIILSVIVLYYSYLETGPATVFILSMLAIVVEYYGYLSRKPKALRSTNATHGE